METNEAIQTIFLLRTDDNASCPCHNFKMPTIVVILNFMTRPTFMLMSFIMKTSFITVGHLCTHVSNTCQWWQHSALQTFSEESLIGTYYEHIDWLQSLKQIFINVSNCILVASLTLMALFKTESSELDCLHVNDMAHWRTIVLRTGASLMDTQNIILSVWSLCDKFNVNNVMLKVGYLSSVRTVGITSVNIRTSQ